MTRLLLFICLFGISSVASAAGSYIKTYGNPAHQALIFLHGGPGGSSLDFELSTAMPLSQLGLFIIVYDRKGEGRSYEDNVAYGFQQTNQELIALFEQYNLKKAVLLGHSFGGIVAVKFAEKYPEKVSHLILTGTPFSLQWSFSTILHNAQASARESKDSLLQKQVEQTQVADKHSLQYSAGCFALAMQTGAYTVKHPTGEATRHYTALMQHAELINYTQSLKELQYAPMFKPVSGFWKNEQYTGIEIIDAVQQIRKKSIAVFGIYGQEDGLFDHEHFEHITVLLGKENFKLVPRASHGIFMDQQEIFIQSLLEWIRK